MLYSLLNDVLKKSGELTHKSLKLRSAITPLAVHLEKIRNHLHQKSENNAEIRSFAPIGIQLREMHPLQGYLHIANIQLSFNTFINVLRHSNSLKQLSLARIVNTITLK